MPITINDCMKCGSKAKSHSVGTDRLTWSVRCTKCRNYGETVTRDEYSVVKDWNRCNPPKEELERLRSIPKPKCPHCDTEMYVAEFEGYYDILYFWACNCDDSLLKKLVTSRQQGIYT